MIGWLVRWVVMTVAVMIVAKVYRGLNVIGWWDAFLSAVLLSVVNAFIRPVVVVLTLPINIMTLGLFTLVINALLLLLVDAILPGLRVSGFWAAVLASLFIGMLSFLMNVLIGSDGRVGRMRWERR
jgi:putative membrane protein